MLLGSVDGDLELISSVEQDLGLNTFVERDRDRKVVGSPEKRRPRVHPYGPTLGALRDVQPSHYRRLNHHPYQNVSLYILIFIDAIPEPQILEPRRPRYSLHRTIIGEAFSTLCLSIKLPHLCPASQRSKPISRLGLSNFMASRRGTPSRVSLSIRYLNARLLVSNAPSKLAVAAHIFPFRMEWFLPQLGLPTAEIWSPETD